MKITNCVQIGKKSETENIPFILTEVFDVTFYLENVYFKGYLEHFTLSVMSISFFFPSGDGEIPLLIKTIIFFMTFCKPYRVW